MSCPSSGELGQPVVVGFAAHPAHAPGHAALLIEERGVLVAGDMLSDVFVPMLNDLNGTNDPIEDYLIGLRLLEDAAGDVHTGQRQRLAQRSERDGTPD